jgi:hypothetical protein
LAFIFQSLKEFKLRKDCGQEPDWRIKEALLAALGYLSDEVESFKEV